MGHKNVIEEFDPLREDILQVIDGAEVARFMNDVIHLLENPGLLLLESGEE
ncbi:MAG: hypothetical protein MUP98_03130 [Candidatus Aminicenantes bacterium]|nr:hypothetical protein [Candidatus Aminicenantes bacterium]